MPGPAPDMHSSAVLSHFGVFIVFVGIIQTENAFEEGFDIVENDVVARYDDERNDSGKENADAETDGHGDEESCFF